MDRNELDTELLAALGEMTYCVAFNVFKTGSHQPLNDAKRLAFCQCAGILANILLAKIYDMRVETGGREWIE